MSWKEVYNCTSEPLFVSPSKKEVKSEVEVVAGRAALHLSRQNETKRRRWGKKIKQVDVELTCLWLLSVRVAPGPSARGKSSVMAFPAVLPLKDTDQTHPSHGPSQPLAPDWLTPERLSRCSVFPNHFLPSSCPRSLVLSLFSVALRIKALLKDESRGPLQAKEERELDPESDGGEWWLGYEGKNEEKKKG